MYLQLAFHCHTELFRWHGNTSCFGLNFIYSWLWRWSIWLLLFCPELFWDESKSSFESVSEFQVKSQDLLVSKLWTVFSFTLQKIVIRFSWFKSVACHFKFYFHWLGQNLRLPLLQDSNPNFCDVTGGRGQQVHNQVQWQQQQQFLSQAELSEEQKEFFKLYLCL